MSIQPGDAGAGNGRTANDAGGEPVDLGVLDVLDGLDQRPLRDHVEAYEQVHATLHGALNRIDEA